MKRLIRSTTARAFSLVEAVASIAIVSLMVVAAMNAVGAARGGEYIIAERSLGLFLAQDLIGEIQQQSYADPVFGGGSIGLGGDEVGDGHRALWDDVDDYHGWSASPPERKDGTVIAGFEDWERSVTVQWLDPINLNQAVGGNQGVKGIEVSVRHRGRLILSLFAIRTETWPALGDI